MPNNQQLPPIPTPVSFASELIKARSEQGLTQAQLATKSTLSLSAIKAYEAGRNLPGARELRELCQALEISPNMLLFGTETPFAAKSFLNQLADSGSEDAHLTSARSSVLLGLLAADERRAIFTLIHALAVARHGEQKVKETLLPVDAMVSLSREMARATRDAPASSMEIVPEAMSENVDATLQRLGHKPNP